MVKEVDLQATILVGVREAGGWGKKMSNMYISGIPDLLIVLASVTYIVEIKKLNALPVRDTDLIKFAHPLTELQNQCLIGINTAGGCAGWLAVYTKGMVDFIVTGRDKRDIPTRQEFYDRCVKRNRGPQGTSWATILPRVLFQLGIHVPVPPS